MRLAWRRLSRWSTLQNLGGKPGCVCIRGAYGDAYAGQLGDLSGEPLRVTRCAGDGADDRGAIRFAMLAERLDEMAGGIGVTCVTIVLYAVTRRPAGVRVFVNRDGQVQHQRVRGSHW